MGSPAAMIQALTPEERDRVRMQNVESLQRLNSQDYKHSESQAYYMISQIFEVSLIGFFLLLQAVALVPCLLLFNFVLSYLGTSLSASMMPIFFLFYGVVSFLLSVLIKALVMPRFRGKHPYWSTPFMTWGFVNRLMEFGSKIVFRNVRGSSLAALVLKLYGAKVGKDVFFDTYPPCEMDLINIGDNVVLQEESYVIGHVVDNARLQHHPVFIENDCTINVDSLILPGAVLKEGCTLGPLSLVLKGEVLNANTYWSGNPAQSMTDVSFR